MIRRPVRDAGGSRLTGRDLLRVGSLGLRSRRVRAVLSALGISIGIAAIVGVLGISQSSKSGLLNELGQLGNLLTVQASEHRLRSADRAAHHRRGNGGAHRTGHERDRDRRHLQYLRVPQLRSCRASTPTASRSPPPTPHLPATLGASVAHGTFLNAATAHFPAVVLGAETASLLGIENLAHPTQVWIGGYWFTVVGILNPVQLVSQMDSMAFIGFPIAEQYFGFDGHPTELFLRSRVHPGQRRGRRAAPDREPAEPDHRGVDRTGGHPEGRGGRQGGLQRAVPRPRCRGPPRRRCRHRQRHGHLGPRTALRDRPATGARRHAGATSPSSSSQKPYSSRSSAAWPAPSSAWPQRRSTR